MKKRNYLLLAMMALGLSLTACSNGDKAESKVESKAEQVESKTESKAEQVENKAESVETVSYTHPPSPRDGATSRMPSSA